MLITFWVYKQILFSSSIWNKYLLSEVDCKYINIIIIFIIIIIIAIMIITLGPLLAAKNPIQ